MNQRHKKAFLLGAGASYDFGMPLVWELTKELRSFLNPEKVESVNQVWGANGVPFSKKAILILKDILQQTNFHYEHIIGALEVEAMRHRVDNKLTQDLRDIIGWILDAIYYLLYCRQQVANTSYINLTLELYSRFDKFVRQNYYFWIFSLNHDLSIELLAKHYNIPIKTGFSSFEYNKDGGKDITFRFPTRDNKTCQIIDEITFEVMHIKELTAFPLNYYKHSTDAECINLFKLHGSLDSFVFNDSLYLKMLSKQNTFQGVLQDLVSVNSKMIYPGGFNIIDKYYTKSVVENMICFADYEDKMQFLGKSLLSGMHKFNKNTSNYKIPHELLDAFKTHINYVDHLIIIGYSFGDSHVNQVVREWIAFTKDRRITIVNPSISEIPNDLKIYIGQIAIKNETFLEFLCRETLSPLTNDENMIHTTRTKIRK